MKLLNLRHVAIAVILALAIPGVNQAFGGLPKQFGVFPIIQFSSVQGAAFLIDENNGWLLTAGHVMSRCRTSAPTQPVNIRVVYSFETGGSPLSTTQLIEVRPIVWGYDFTKSTNYEGTVQDWVLLQATDTHSTRVFKLFKEVIIDPASNPDAIANRAAQSTPVTAYILGFPFQVSESLQFPCNFARAHAENGLWMLSASVASGNSGGPCIIDGELIGIVLKSGSGRDLIGNLLSLPNTCHINPIYSFLPTIARQLPLTTGVQEFSPYFNSEVNSTNLAEQLLPLYELIPTLNAVEKWQVVKLACSGTRSARHKFLYDFFSRFIDENGWIARALMSCLTYSELGALLRENRNVVEAAQLRGFTNSVASVKVANLVANIVLNGYESFNVGDSELVATTVCDAVYTRNMLFGLSQNDSKDLRALAWARRTLKGASPKVPVAYLAAVKDLSDEEKRTLSQYALLLAMRESSDTNKVALTMTSVQELRVPKDPFGVGPMEIHNNEKWLLQATTAEPFANKIIAGIEKRFDGLPTFNATPRRNFLYATNN